MLDVAAAAIPRAEATCRALLGLPGCPERDAASDERHHQHERQRGAQAPETTVAPRLTLGHRSQGPLLGLGELDRCVEERRLDLGQDWARRVVAPLEGRFQPGAAVELGVRAAERVPPVGGADEVAEHPLAGDVVVEPRPQAGPRSGQCLVGDLEGVALGGDQPGAHEETDDPIAARVAEDRAARHPAADWVTVECRGDESEQDRPQGVALVGGKAVVETVGRAGDGHADPAAAFVALDGERCSVASPPRLREGVRQQRQGAGLALTVTHEQVDETGFQTKPGRTCRLLDGVAQAHPR